MKYSIWINQDDSTFDGRMYDEGENELYDRMTEWFVSDDANAFSDELKQYVNMWSSKGWIEGGSLYNPNGLTLGFKTEFSPEIEDVVINTIQKKVDEICAKYQSTSPIPLEFDVYVHDKEE